MKVGKPEVRAYGNKDKTMVSYGLSNVWERMSQEGYG